MLYGQSAIHVCCMSAGDEHYAVQPWPAVHNTGMTHLECAATVGNSTMCLHKASVKLKSTRPHVWSTQQR